MKPTMIKHGRLLLVVLAAGLTIGLISWDRHQSPGRYEQAINDTTPKKNNSERDKKVRDLDDVLDQLDKLDNLDMGAELEKMKKEMTEAFKQFDGNKINLEIEKALKEVDMGKIKKEVELALKQVDLTKIQQELEQSLAKADFNKIKDEITTALKGIDMEKIQQEIRESMKEADWDHLKAGLDKVKQIDMSKLNEDMKKLGEEMKELGPQLEKEMKKARVEIEKAKAEIREYKEFVDGLDKDGLISKKDGYTLRHQDGELTINGKKADAATYGKYRAFLDKHPKFRIEKSDDDFDIDTDD